MNIILKYFPDLSDEQYKQLSSLKELYKSWNDQINVISRKDIDELDLHHVLHSLSISKYVDFKPGTVVFDLGTGGGFPGIPLAILYPDVNFHLMDARAKKIKVVLAIAEEIGLQNLTAAHGRAEEHKKQYDFIVSRAVAPLAKLWNWSRDKIKGNGFNDVPNGLITLKGGDLNLEMSELPLKVDIYKRHITEWFEEAYFEEKQLIHLSKK